MPLPGGAITLLQKKGSCKSPKKRDGSASPSRTAASGQGSATSPRRRHSQNQPPPQASLVPGSPQPQLSRRPSSPMNLSPSAAGDSPRTTPKSPKVQTREHGKISPHPRH